MSRGKGRVLGVDLGAKRIGLALSDPDRIIASSLGHVVCRGNRQDVEVLAALVAEREVAEVVVGLPLHLSGEESPGSRRARSFAQKLAERLSLPVHLIDESLTTAEAEDILVEADVSRRKRRQVVDGMAAAIILRAWLNEQEEINLKP
jgi:putative Holliday junction resolvase